MDKFEIKTKFEQGCKNLPRCFVVNITVDHHIYNQADLVIFECLTEHKGLGLYVSLNKPYETICEELDKNNLDCKEFYCIDGVSKETGKFSNTNKVFCLEDPSSLTELSLLIKTLCNEDKIKFIILNSLYTLLLYNDAEAVEKFLHKLLNKARKSNVSVAIMSPKEKSKEDIFADITQFCDHEIEL